MGLEYSKEATNLAMQIPLANKKQLTKQVDLTGISTTVH